MKHRPASGLSAFGIGSVMDKVVLLRDYKQLAHNLYIPNTRIIVEVTSARENVIFFYFYLYYTL